VQIYLGLIANVLVFFHKPLFSENYIFPWDFRYVQLPMVSFLAEELRRGKLALWDPFTYCANPIFANIQASFFHPLVLAGAALSALTSLDSLPMIMEWVVALQVCFAGIAAFHLFRQMGAGMPSAFAGAVVFERRVCCFPDRAYWRRYGGRVDAARLAIGSSLEPGSWRKMAGGPGCLPLHGRAGRISPSDHGRVRFDRGAVDRSGAFQNGATAADRHGPRRLRPRGRTGCRSVHPDYATHQLQRGEVSRGLVRYRRRALLAEFCVAGRAEPPSVRSGAIQGTRRPLLSLSQG
jgi:hypothetical protein